MLFRTRFKNINQNIESKLLTYIKNQYIKLKKYTIFLISGYIFIQIKKNCITNTTNKELQERRGYVVSKKVLHVKFGMLEMELLNFQCVNLSV